MYFLFLHFIPSLVFLNSFSNQNQSNFARKHFVASKSPDIKTTEIPGDQKHRVGHAVVSYFTFIGEKDESVVCEGL